MCILYKKYTFVNYLSNGNGNNSSRAETCTRALINRRKLLNPPKIAIFDNCCSSTSRRATNAHKVQIKDNGQRYLFVQNKYPNKLSSFCTRWVRSSSLGFVLLFERHYSHFPPLQDLFDTLNHLVLVTNEGIKRIFWHDFRVHFVPGKGEQKNLLSA